MKRYLLIVTLTFLPVCASADEWQPPENPDPQAILNEVRADRQAGRYADALAKHVWFHDHALEHQPSMSGVRLTSALSDWQALAKEYPPALILLENARTTAAENVVTGRDVFQSFFDLSRIDRQLGDEELTRSVFEGLDRTDPKSARRVYHVAQPTLIRAKAYKLCAKYIDPQIDFPRMQLQLRLTKRSVDDGTLRPSILEFTNKSFTNKAATLVALLVVNEREAEAKQIANAAKQEWDDASFHAEIDKALAGTVPAPWPR